MGADQAERGHGGWRRSGSRGRGPVRFDREGRAHGAAAPGLAARRDGHAVRQRRGRRRPQGRRLGQEDPAAERGAGVHGAAEGLRQRRGRRGVVSAGLGEGHGRAHEGAQGHGVPEALGVAGPGRGAPGPLRGPPPPAGGDRRVREEGPVHGPPPQREGAVVLRVRHRPLHEEHRGGGEGPPGRGGGVLGVLGPAVPRRGCRGGPEGHHAAVSRRPEAAAGGGAGGFGFGARHGHGRGHGRHRREDPGQAGDQGAEGGREAARAGRAVRRALQLLGRLRRAREAEGRLRRAAQGFPVDPGAGLRGVLRGDGVDAAQRRGCRAGHGRAGREGEEDGRVRAQGR
mmetsp:Transcript_15490/g.38190  ORF Transcript_15490/g.38190 Transcript_15490/m.38190 type:complete len:342 (+) Transcript_15490:950-1975(+)